MRAKWIHTAKDHEDRPGQTLATQSPEVIRQWAGERGGVPSTVPSARRPQPSVLRFDFPGFGGRTLQHIEWSDWLRVFTDRELVFLFQEHRRDGRASNFFRLDSPHRERG